MPCRVRLATALVGRLCRYGINTLGLMVADSACCEQQTNAHFVSAVTALAGAPKGWRWKLWTFHISMCSPVTWNTSVEKFLKHTYDIGIFVFRHA